MASSDSDLFEGLFEKGYKIISFPGCITDQKKYMEWHSGKSKAKHHSACEGFGVTLRLFDPTTDILIELDAFMKGEAFNRAVARKFGIDYDGLEIDGGIQKYLDGYEISPHPDIRRKAATFMVNINPNAKSETSDHHPHYLKFTPEREYVQSYWEGNSDIERCWVPWDWTETVKQQTRNNSIVLFSPADDTMHGVKADYDHLLTQRTQLYGNLWYSNPPKRKKVEWEEIDIVNGPVSAQVPLSQKLRRAIPSELKTAIKRVTGKKQAGTIGQRNKQ